jgi:hypothetical protein
MHGGDVLRIGEIELKLDLLLSPAMSFDATITPRLNDEETPVPRLVIVTPDAYSGRSRRDGPWATCGPGWRPRG